MKLALRIAVVCCLALAGWWMFERADRTRVIESVAPTTQAATTQREVVPSELPALVEQARVEAPVAEDARAVAPTPVVAAETKSTSTALLRVHVFARETRKPLASQRVLVIAKDVEHSSWKHIEGSHATVGEAPLTDADGRAELEVEPGHELTVHVGEHYAHEPTTVAALTIGEKRDVDVDLPTEPDRTLFGRLVDAETKQAIADGAIWCEDTSAHFVLNRHGSDSSAEAKGEIPNSAMRSHSDGSFELHVRSWEQKFANAKADGYSRVVFTVDASHATRDGALEVQLSRAATLAVVVLDGAHAVADATVNLTTKSYQLQQRSGFFDFYSDEDPHWSARTDANGRAEVVDLPPRIPLTLSVRAPGHAVYNQGEPLSLDRGERRDLNIALGSGASIIGRIEDRAGKPLAGCEIWRLAAEVPVAKLLESYEHPVATTRSDEQGRFHFDDVAAGSWLVGPKPESRWDRNAKTTDALAALAEPVVIDANVHQVEVVLRVDVGLFLRGTVVDPAGAPMKDTNVSAQRAGAWIYVNENTDEAGRFTLGPLPAGTYAIEAGAFRGEYAKSESVSAQAGDSDIVLRLRVGGAIRGQVVDATHQPRGCELTLADGEDFGWMMTTTNDGKVAFDGLLPGTYSVSAKSSDGMCGRRTGLVVRAAETIDNVEIVLEPGARLKVRYNGEAPYGSYGVFAGGVPCGGDGLERGKESVVIVPAGEIEVRWMTKDPKAPHTQRVTLSAGEEREVVWDGKP